MLFLTPLIVSASVCAQDSVRFGTLIGAYGNKQGIAVVTDSQIATLDENNHVVLSSEPGQKLLKLDDRTVVAVAGLEFVPVTTMHSLSASTLALIANYRVQVPQFPFDRLLRGISGTLQFYLTTITEIKSKTHLRTNETFSPVEVILAGYDIDGTAKIGKIKVQYIQLPGGGFIAEEIFRKIDTVGEEFTHETGGINELAEALLTTSRSGVYNPPVLQKYWLALQNGTRKDLTVEELAQLGDSLENETHGKTDLVGGLSQTAILEAGHARTLVAPDVFQPLITPFPLMVAKDSSFSGGGVLVLKGSPNTVIFYDTVRFSGRVQPVGQPPLPISNLTLDGNIFVNCSFENVVIYYGGEQAYLDSSSVFIKTHFWFGPNVPADVQNYYRKLIGQAN